MSDLVLKLYVQLQALRAREEGQGMVEYALILVLVSIFALVALRTIGTNLVGEFSQVNGAFPG